jgi:hypothetical protein
MPGRYHYIQRPVPSPVPAELRAFADANRDAIRIISDIRSRRQVDWDVSFRDWSNVPLNSIRILFDAIHITALMDLEAGRADDAAQMIVSSLGISAAIRQEPTLFWLMHVFRWSLTALRELVSAGTPSAAALEDLARWLVENRAPDFGHGLLLAQMRMGNAVLARLERGDVDPLTAEIIYPMSWPDWPKVFMGPAAQIGRPLVRTARLRYLRYMDRVLDVQEGPRPRPVLPEPEPPKPWALVDRLVGRVTGDEWDYIDSSDDFASELAVAELGVALRRYKLDRGAYPESLSALTPAYLDRLPIDPYTGTPPAYVRVDEGFTLRARSSNPHAVKWLALEWTVLK